MWQTPSSGCQTQMVYLVESGNDSHREILDHCSRLQMEYPSNSPNPGDQVLSIEDPTTCRKIFPPDAPGVLNRFAEALGAFNWGDRPLLLPTWDRIGPTTYRCTVEFPTEFKIPAMSTSHSNAMEAKRAVCFSACKVLFSLGLLDYRIFPPFPQDSGLSSELTDLKASELSIATRCYSKRTPPFWRKSLKLDNRKLYPNIITVKFSQGSNHSSIILLTRLPLPITSTFRIFCSGAVGEVAVRNAQAFVVDDEQLATLHGFTIRVARSVLNKPITFSLGELPYLFAPLPRGWKPPPENERWWNPPDVARHISWDVARLAAKDFVTPLVSGSSSLDDAADDAIIQDRWVEFTNRHFLAKVRHDMTPLSKPEEGIVSLFHSVSCHH